jgi:predicted DNA-binding transcriptional regulator AlpA
MTRARDLSLLPPSLAPFGVSRETAAELVGIGVSVFDQMVGDGRMPQPRVASQKRFVWDVQELLAAFRKLPHRQPLAGNREVGNPWDDDEEAA